jgi:hypothetical protein
MFAEAGTAHHLPHFHAYYDEHVGIYGIDPVGLIGGSLPKRQERLAEAWAELPQAELRADWDLLRQLTSRPCRKAHPINAFQESAR